MAHLYVLAHRWGPVAQRHSRRLGLVVLLLLLAACSTVLWFPQRTGFEPCHVAAALSDGSVVHIAMWQPGPAYVGQEHPPTGLGRPVIIVWQQASRHGPVTSRHRFDLPVWPAKLPTVSVALAALLTGSWPLRNQLWSRVAMRTGRVRQ